ncbi:hypothetical protein G6O69_38205 [Pseudenhygromyxa sp. WMMC2535]|uniref:hypothetical protein n=1 Tax=Pseudenhygromyxa sp. WMMC2535 TaxID=2712867 RepID=UPI001557FE17|nr:hypothetical protein [Pseudenhygromyxa sp. WMMC2535]NVB42701.1 hypothetical protein [Pseudenhygromyxa sp. WMMC2535]NVB43701.1 hypothetical protein [Pseudenhygromyxa sp. WMMC2535]
MALATTKAQPGPLEGPGRKLWPDHQAEQRRELGLLEGLGGRGHARPVHGVDPAERGALEDIDAWLRAREQG